MTDIDKVYSELVFGFRKLKQFIIPYLRRFIRFLALPYAYFFLVNWNECTASRGQVLKDFLYIFFVLKDFPDYYTVFRLWEKERSEWKYYYGSIYNPYQRGRLRRLVQPQEYEILFEDKMVCQQLLSGMNLPLPKFIGYLTPDGDYRAFLKSAVEENSRPLIIKNARGKGGADIFLIFKENNDIFVKSSDTKKLLSHFTLTHPSLVQEFIQQHPELEKISESVNTVRTETLLTKDNDIIILGAFIRFGKTGNFVDNQCAGGLSIGVNLEDGRLYDFAMDGKGEKYYQHPDSGITFKDFKIPFWNDVMELSRQIQRNFPYFRLLGPDIAITEHGPVIIEVNATPDHAGLEMDYGPVLKDRRVWQEFKKYDLLINNPSRNLYG